MKKILLLGASGFVGHNMLNFLENKYDLVHPSHTELDVLNEAEVAQYLKLHQYDVVLNCLDWRYSDHNYFENKLRMFNNLAKYRDSYGKMIYFGSGAEYARDLPIVDIVETAFDRKIPVDTYGCCMHQISMMAMHSENIYNLRLFGVWGKYEIWQRRFISNAICKAMFGYPITIRQDCCFDYLFIDDLCRIVQWFIENEPVYHDYNAVSGEKYYLRELAELVVKESGKDIPIYIAREGIGNEYSASNKRLCQEMKDFSPTDIREAIHEAYLYYESIQDQIDRYTLLYQE